MSPKAKALSDWSLRLRIFFGTLSTSTFFQSQKIRNFFGAKDEMFFAKMIDYSYNVYFVF